jgi:hypothetical protein
MNAELGVVTARAYEGVRASLNAYVEAKNHPGRAAILGEPREARKFLDSIHCNAAKSPAASRAQFVVGLSGTVQRKPLRGKSGAFGGNELAKRTDIKTDGAARQMTYELDRSECFGGIGDLKAAILAGAASKCVDRAIDDV